MATLSGVRIELLPSPLLAEAATAGPLWRVFGERILSRSKALCPVSEGASAPPTSGGSGRDSRGRFVKKGGHLKDTLYVRFVRGPDARIEIGSAQTVQGGLNKLALILEGTEPHPIDPVNAQALRFTAGGTVVFAAHVDHPGTRSNDFVQRAMRQLCREVGGVAV